MVSLISKTPCDGLEPVTIGAVELRETLPGPITWIAPFDGRQKAVSEALKSALGMGFPAPNRTTGKDGARAVWFGPGQALVLGSAVDLPGAAVVDQSDGWAALTLEGAGARDVLARLVPIDLRDGAFKRGHTARTLLGHMTVSLMRTGAERFDILVFRSMAATAVHELTRAMERVAARG